MDDQSDAFVCEECGAKAHGRDVYGPIAAVSPFWSTPPGWFFRLGHLGLDAMCSETCARAALAREEGLDG